MLLPHIGVQVNNNFCIWMLCLTWTILHSLTGYRGRSSWISCLIWLWSLSSILWTNYTLQGTRTNGSQCSMVILRNSWRLFLTVECHYILYIFLELESYDILILSILIAGHNSSKAYHTILQFSVTMWLLISQWVISTDVVCKFLTVSWNKSLFMSVFLIYCLRRVGYAKCTSILPEP